MARLRVALRKFVLVASECVKLCPLKILLILLISLIAPPRESSPEPDEMPYEGENEYTFACDFRLVFAEVSSDVE
jgi:hypothetical protein